MMYAFVIWFLAFFGWIALYRFISVIIPTYAVTFFRMSPNWARMVTFILTTMLFLMGVRMLLPATGMDMHIFTGLIAFLIQTSSWGFRSFIENWISYLHVLFGDTVREGDEFLLNGRWYTIHRIEPQFLNLHDFTEDGYIVHTRLPIGVFLTSQTSVKYGTQKKPVGYKEPKKQKQVTA